VAGTGSALVYSLLSGSGSGALQCADLLLAAAAVSAAMAYALGGEMARRIGGWEVICWAAAVAVRLADQLGRACVGLGRVLLRRGGMFLGFLAWNKGLAIGGIAKVGQIQLLQPFVALAAGALLLGEEVGWLELVFAAVVGPSSPSVGVCRWRKGRGGMPTWEPPAKNGKA